jgi:hypothetical protein
MFGHFLWILSHVLNQPIKQIKKERGQTDKG